MPILFPKSQRFLAFDMFMMKAVDSVSSKTTLWAFIALCSFSVSAQPGRSWVEYKGGKGPGSGKHIVWISGDEEYRSEEALPMLAKILSFRYGFRSTVLFSVDSSTGKIDPSNLANIPGLDQLRSADLMVIFTRFRELPDEQMKFIDDYINLGKPVLGMRTATHAFNYVKNKSSRFAKYSFKSTVQNWEDGFGRRILGETWVGHHGDHGSEGTRGLIAGIVKNKSAPILRGVTDIWGPTDVYSLRDISGDADVLVFGLPTNGMHASAPLNWRKSLMPIAWTKTYTSDAGNTGRVFTTTMGAAVDLACEDLRRLIVNAIFWCMDMEDLIPEKANVQYVGAYVPSMFGFDGANKTLMPADFNWAENR